MLHERSFEPGIAPQPTEPAQLLGGGVGDGGAPGVVGGVSSNNCDRDEQTQSVDDAKDLAARDLLACVISPWYRQ